MKNEITEFRLSSLLNPKYIKASFAKYRQNGVAKDWELIQAHDSVAILIYERKEKSFILVKQFRPAVYLNNNDGMTVELCAGLVDKRLTLKEIAKEEILEECGYDVELCDIEKIVSFRTAVGFAGSQQTLYYTEVDEDTRVSDGGGIDDELIEVVKLPVDEALDFIYDESIAKTSGLMFAFMWWFDKFIKN